MSQPTQTQPSRTGHRGFTLPAVLISSVIMVALLLGAMQISSSTIRALREQYYNQLAREAAEAGAERIGDCVRKGHYYDFTTGPHKGKRVKPDTDCAGNVQPGRSTYMMQTSGTPRLRIYYAALYHSGPTGARAQETQVGGFVELLRASDNKAYQTYSASSRQQVSQEVDPLGSRASKKWWFFGQATRLDFGTEGTKPPIASMMQGGAANMKQHEGVTVVADRSGDLRFFSDGRTIWNKHGNVIPVHPAGTNTAPNCDAGTRPFIFGDPNQRLCGSRTATQAVAAFPLNRQETRYIVVTNTANVFEQTKDWRYGTLYATMVSFEGAHKETGQILFRNIPLRPPAGVNDKYYAAEALNARPNATGNGAVVYTYRPNNPTAVYAFPLLTHDEGVHLDYGKPANQLTLTGPNARPIMCDAEPGVDKNNLTSFGTINFNRNYTRMIVMMGGSRCKGADGHKNAGVLHLFDISEGDTAMRHLASWSMGAQEPQDRSIGYSADFSPEGKYIYATKIYTGQLYRYDISGANETNPAAIKQSERFIGYTACDYYWFARTAGNHALGPAPCSPAYPTSKLPGGEWERPDWLGRPSDGGGQVLRGPDGRMYIADRGSQHISVVDNPDTDNAPTAAATAAKVGWRYAGVNLVDHTLSFYGLPQMVTLHSPRLLRY